MLNRRATCCARCGTTPTWPTRASWTRACSASAAKIEPTPGDPVYIHRCAGSVTASRPALREQPAQAAVVVTFTVVAVTASFMVAGIGYQIVRGELLRRAESSAVEDVRDTMNRLTLPIGTSDLLSAQRRLGHRRRPAQPRHQPPAAPTAR